MLIAKKGKFSIQQEEFLGTRQLTTHSLELCKTYENTTNGNITIAKITSDGDLKSIGLRLIDHIDNAEDLANCKKLIEILYNIVMETDEVNIERCQ